MKNKPKITVITVCYNDLIRLKPTVQNILNQNLQNFEYLIFDGCSNDGTSDFLINLPNDHRKVHYIQKDSGIWDAMNQATQLAKGEWLIFINAGDFLYENTTLTQIADQLSDADVVYGSFMFEYDNGIPQKLHKPLPLNTLTKGLITSHQAIFVKKELLIKHPFASHKLTSDFDLMLLLYKNGNKFKEIPHTISIFSMGGLSDNNRIRCRKEQWQTSRALFPSLSKDIYFVRLIILEYLKKLVKSIIPMSLTKRLIHFLNRFR